MCKYIHQSLTLITLITLITHQSLSAMRHRLPQHGLYPDLLRHSRALHQRPQRFKLPEYFAVQRPESREYTDERCVFRMFLAAADIHPGDLLGDVWLGSLSLSLSLSLSHTHIHTHTHPSSFSVGATHAVTRHMLQSEVHPRPVTVTVTVTPGTSRRPPRRIVAARPLYVCVCAFVGVRACVRSVCGVCV